MDNLRIVTAAVVVGGVLLTAVIGAVGFGIYQRIEVERTVADTQNAASAVELALDRVALAVHAVRAIYGADQVSRDQFQRFAMRLTALEGIRSLAFYRRVESANRATFEATLRDEPARTLGIWENGPDGSPVRAGDRPVYFVLEAAASNNGPPPTYGIDVASLPGRAESIGQSIATFDLVASGTVDFARTNESGVVLYAPVTDRNGAVAGIAAGTVVFTQLANTAALASGTPNINVAVGDQWSPTNNGLAREEPSTSDPTISFAFGGRTWSVSEPLSGAGDPIGRWLVVVVVGAGLAATMAVAAYIVGLSKTNEATAARGRLRGMLDGLGPLAWLLAPDGTIENANRSATTLFKEKGAGLVGHAISEIAGGDDDDGPDLIRRAVKDAAGGADVRFDLVMRDNDDRRILDFWIRPLESGQARPTNLVASAVDVTDRYEAEETQRLLMRELDHRMKNTLQVIQAVIRRTARAQSSIETFEDSLLGRVGAMSRAHELLARERWLGANIHTIVQQETSTFDSGKAISAGGPPIRLNPRAALSIALAFHELGTNASKYGALSSPEGTVEVEWSIDRTGTEPRMVLNWREHGGPTVTPPTNRGFGSMVIERSIAYELDGQAEIDYRPEGLVCRISVPLRTVRPFIADTSVRTTAVI